MPGNRLAQALLTGYLKTRKPRKRNHLGQVLDKRGRVYSAGFHNFDKYTNRTRNMAKYSRSRYSKRRVRRVRKRRPVRGRRRKTTRRSRRPRVYTEIYRTPVDKVQFETGTSQVGSYNRLFCLNPRNTNNSRQFNITDLVIDDIGSKVKQWDSYKYKRCEMEFWLTNTDEFTKASYETVRLMTASDSDCFGRIFSTKASFNEVKNMKEKFLVPNRKYRVSFVPKWSPTFGLWGNGTATLDQHQQFTSTSNRNAWLDVAILNRPESDHIPVSANGVQLYFDGNSGQSLSYRYKLTVQFKGRRNGQTYQDIPV